MKHYDDITPALRAILLNVTRGYRYCVTEEVKADKVPGVSEKWIDNFGTTLSPAKRHARKLAGLPNAWACSMPVPGAPHRRLLVLLRTEANLGKFAPESPWRREKWSDRLEIGDYVITVDKRDRGDYSYTVRLSQACMRRLEGWYRELAGRSLDQLQAQIEHDVCYYPAFGGVRRQLRRLIRGYAKLYEKKRGRHWPGPDPERLPSVGGFRKTGGDE
jgi:hypothetical protein